ESLAEHGRGQYYYVKDASGLEPVFAGELKAIQSTVATAAELRLEPACAGIEIAEVFGYATRRDGAATIVALADLAGVDHRKIVARLKVPTEKLGRVGVVKATLHYTDAKGGPDKTTLAKLGVEVTNESAVVEKNVDRDVMAKITQVETATTMRRAA